jgi:DNA-binding transcriptional LysR family regulator
MGSHRARLRAVRSKSCSIVACVASGTGIALAPESVLETVQHASVTRHALPKVHSDVVTPLIWRASEQSPALVALRELLVRQRSTAKPAKRIACALTCP